jgi:hypothetical protein
MLIKVRDRVLRQAVQTLERLLLWLDPRQPTPSMEKHLDRLFVAVMARAGVVNPSGEVQCTSCGRSAPFLFSDSVAHGLCIRCARPETVERTLEGLERALDATSGRAN